MIAIITLIASLTSLAVSLLVFFKVRKEDFYHRKEIDLLDMEAHKIFHSINSLS